MTNAEWFLKQLDVEADRTRRALENTPEGRESWTPHERSMPLGRLALLIARMPSWIELVVNRDELDLSPPAGGSGSGIDMRPLSTAEELVAALEDSVAKSRDALKSTTDAHLEKPWKLLVAGNVVSEDPRHIVIRDTLMHLAHHRGQYTVYLRMNGAPVPAIYGPSADDSSFG